MNRFRAGFCFLTVVTTSALASLAHGQKSIVDLGSLLANSNEVAATLSPQLSGAVVFRSVSGPSRALTQAGVAWFFPVKFDAVTQQLSPVKVPAGMNLFRSNMDQFLQQIKGVPITSVPEWVRLIFSHGQTVGSLTSLGDIIWVNFDERGQFALNSQTWPDDECSPNSRTAHRRFYGIIRLTGEGVAFELFGVDQGKLLGERLFTSRVSSSWTLDPRALAWIQGLEALQNSEFIRLSRDPRTSFTFSAEAEDLQTRDLSERRESILRAYKSWTQQVLGATTSSIGLDFGALSPMDILDLVEWKTRATDIGRNSVPWSIVPEIREVNSVSLLRLKSDYWRPKSNLLFALSQVKGPGRMSIVDRAVIADVLDHKSPLSGNDHLILQIEAYQRGLILPSVRNISALRLLRLYEFRQGDFSGARAIAQPMLLLTAILYGATCSDGAGTIMDSRAFLAENSVLDIQNVRIRKGDVIRLKILGGNDEHPFTHRTDFRSVAAIGDLLGEIAWKVLGVDSLDALDRLEVELKAVPSVELQLQFRHGIATMAEEEGIQVDPVTRRLGALPDTVKLTLRDAFDRSVTRLKSAPVATP